MKVRLAHYTRDGKPGDVVDVSEARARSLVPVYGSLVEAERAARVFTEDEQAKFFLAAAGLDDQETAQSVIDGDDDDAEPADAS